MNPLTLQTKAIALGLIFVALAGTHTTAYFQGRGARDDEVKVENAKIAAKAAAEYKVAVDYGNKKAAEVQELERTSAEVLTEVLINVSKITTGKSCLSADAVRLLNKPAKVFGLSPSSRKPVEESTGGIATDTDIVNWIARAQDQYKKCAANNNGIVDILVKEGQK
jgi:UDP-N-acetylmuramyl tripeptide synthase